MTFACPACDTQAPVELRGSRESTVGSIAARVERRPVVACPQGHQLSPPEVVGAAMAAVDTAVLRARSRVLRSDVCRSCRAGLTMPVRRTTRSVTVEGAELPIATITLDLPMTRCGSCGLDQVPSRSHEDLTVAIPALFAQDEPSS